MKTFLGKEADWSYGTLLRTFNFFLFAALRKLSRNREKMATVATFKNEKEASFIACAIEATFYYFACLNLFTTLSAM